MNKTQAFFALILLILIIGFAFQVRESVSKYLSGKTTTAIEWKSESALPLPTLSFCPGFKNGGLKPVRKPDKELAILSYFDTHNVSETTEEELMTWWNNYTFEAFELFDFMRPPQDHEVTSNSDGVTRLRLEQRRNEV